MLSESARASYGSRISASGVPLPALPPTVGGVAAVVGDDVDAVTGGSSAGSREEGVDEDALGSVVICASVALVVSVGAAT